MTPWLMDTRTRIVFVCFVPSGDALVPSSVLAPFVAMPCVPFVAMPGAPFVASLLPTLFHHFWAARRAAFAAQVPLLTALALWPATASEAFDAFDAAPQRHRKPHLKGQQGVETWN